MEELTTCRDMVKLMWPKEREQFKMEIDEPETKIRIKRIVGILGYHIKQL